MVETYAVPITTEAETDVALITVEDKTGNVEAISIGDTEVATPASMEPFMHTDRVS